jgi:hypothetical protein
MNPNINPLMMAYAHAMTGGNPTMQGGYTPQLSQAPLATNQGVMSAQHQASPWSPTNSPGGQRPAAGQPGSLQGLFATTPSLLGRWSAPQSGAAIG